MWAVQRKSISVGYYWYLSNEKEPLFRTDIVNPYIFKTKREAADKLCDWVMKYGVVSDTEIKLLEEPEPPKNRKVYWAVEIPNGSHKTWGLNKDLKMVEYEWNQEYIFEYFTDAINTISLYVTNKSKLTDITKGKLSDCNLTSDYDHFNFVIKSKIFEE